MGSKNNKKATKSYLTTLWLSLFLGSLGADRFYLGKWRSGIVKLITLGGFGIWLLVDAVLIGAGKVKDSRGHRLAGFSVNAATVQLSSLLLVLLLIGVGLVEIFVPASSGTSTSPNEGNLNSGVIIIGSFIGLGLLLGWLFFIVFTVADAYRRGDWLWVIINVLSFLFGFGVLNIVYYHFVRNKADDFII